MIVKCPHCGREEDAPEEYVGETAICDSCNGEYVVGGITIPHSAFDEQGNAIIECPYCHAQNNIKLEYANRNVRCCECDGKYHIQVQEQSNISLGQQAIWTRCTGNPSQHEDDLVRFEEPNLLRQIMPGFMSNLNTTMQIWKTLCLPLSLPFGIMVPITVMCDKCKKHYHPIAA